MTNKKKYGRLIRRYLDNQASDEELDVFFDLLKKGEIDIHLDAALQEDEDKIVRTMAGVARVVPLRKWRRLAVAAIMTGLILLAGLWYGEKMTKKAPATDMAGSLYQNDIRPARNHALLTIPGGKVIDLDSNSTGAVALQAGARLVKNGAGEWEYRAKADRAASGGKAAEGDGAATSAGRSVEYNTILAPRGGQFAFVLEDGTRVWLNASSSMRFPTAFTGKSRDVALEGEAYFEVANNPRMPFVVQAGGMQVRVLGTHFNVNAYTDETAIRTTLLEGSVKISKDRAEALLQPGEQASLKPDGKINTVKDPDVVDAAMAWRTGYFSFDEDNIQTVMRQIARWYDVYIRYEGPVTKAAFGGDIGRDLTLVQVLRVLEKSQVHFRLEGKVLTILP
jgi:transmembrane sensor